MNSYVCDTHPGDGEICGLCGHQWCGTCGTNPYGRCHEDES